MLQVYSANVEVAATTAIPFNSVALKKGCAEALSGASTIELNKCGVYEVTVNASTEASTTIQLYRNGVALPAAQSTGTNPTFTTYVQVSENNTCCPCSSATLLQVVNSTATTFTNCNLVVRKIA